MNTYVATGKNEKRPAKSKAYAAIVWHEFKKNKGALIGLGLVIFFISIGLLAPYISPHDPLLMNQANRLQPPSITHWLGTDEHGRDLMSRIIHGARISTTVGVVAVLIAGVGGVTLGLTAGYWKSADAIIMTMIDLLMAFPFLLLAIGIVSILGPSLTNTMIAVGIGGIAGYCRVTRAEVLRVRELEFVEAAHALGYSNARIILNHILPNVLAPIIVMVTLTLGSSILGAAALSFLGLGAQPPQPEWGFMLNSARSFVMRAWWYSVFPGLAIMLMVLGFNMLGDGLRDALDPRLKNMM